MNSERFCRQILPLINRFLFYLMIDLIIEPLLMQDGARCYWSRFTRAELERWLI
jgi:hypothetical protein